MACGNGFFTEHFAKKAQVVGADIGEQLIAAARRKNPGIEFIVTPAHKLEMLATGSYNKVTIILAIQNIAEVKETLTEMNRVLISGGKAYLVLNHPAFRIPKRSSWQWDEQSHTQYRRIDGYLYESKIGIDMHPGASAKDSAGKIETVSFHRPLQYYFKLFQASGFAVTRLEEWISDRISQSGPRQKEEDRIRKEIPLFLFLEIQKK